MSSQNIKIAIDIMGGDNAPYAPIDGIIEFAKNTKDVEFVIFGVLSSNMKNKLTSNNVKFEYIETSEIVDANEKPANAVRKKQNSSMALAIQAVRDQKANSCVSAGNTGVLMAMSKIYLGSMENVTRPALCTIVPTKESCTVLLDMGANIECDPENLYQFAVMGQAFIRSVYNIQNPTVGILNIGSEEEKGSALVKNAYKICQERLNASEFTGFIEADDLATGKVNVIVTDGFTGNVALKTFEGSGKLMAFLLKQYLSSSFFAKIGCLLAKSALRQLFHKIDPNNYNGALLLGLKGTSVKSHGSATGGGFANAIMVAYNLVKNDAINNIKKRLVSRK